MSVFERLEKALEALAEGGAERIFGGRLDLVAVGQELYNAAVAHSRAGVQGVEAPSFLRVNLSLDDFGELGDQVVRLQKQYQRSLWKRLCEAGYALASAPQVLVTSRDRLAPGRFEVETEFCAGPPTCVLTVLGPEGRSQHVAAPAVIGREAGCALQVSSPSVSRRHAEIRWDRNRFVVADLGSKNGTLRNGARVSVAPLEPGDVVVLGDERVRFAID
jgi:hypothetical protein